MSNPPLENSWHERLNENKNGCLYTEKIDIFPPRYEIKSFFDISKKYIDKIVKKSNNEYPTYNITINYEDIYKKQHTIEYKLSISHIQKPTGINNEMDDIEASLSKIPDNLNNISNKLGDINEKIIYN